MRQFSRCTPGRSRGLWEQPVFVANQDERWCSWCSWNDTRSLSGETFPEVSHCEHNQTRPPCRERADSVFIQEPWQQTEGYCQGVELNVRMCVYGWLRNENGWKCVLLLNPFSPRLSVRKQPLNCLLCSFFTHVMRVESQQMKRPHGCRRSDPDSNPQPLTWQTPEPAGASHTCMTKTDK